MSETSILWTKVVGCIAYENLFLLVKLISHIILCACCSDDSFDIFQFYHSKYLKYLVYLEDFKSKHCLATLIFDHLGHSSINTICLLYCPHSVIGQASKNE